MAAGAVDVFVYTLATFLGNVGVAVTGFGMAIVYLFVWQVARLRGWEADFKHAVFIRAIGLFAAQPLLLRQANIRKHGSRNLLKLFVPVAVLSTPLGQWLGIYVDEKTVQTAGGIVICLFAAFEVSGGNKTHTRTDTIDRRFPPKKYENMGNGGKTETPNMWETIGRLFICMHFFVSPRAPPRCSAAAGSSSRPRAAPPARGPAS
ncbi:unnamed protein product [Prorocentrum cordatum]|uniref:Uncharacterized protein n=1 Tax=Prorocentrum cordatum TaxID=2364126 RepID=A0ABN9UUJ3_9DINO|nr:unnamed protein product [Polarella glacialis]